MATEEHTRGEIPTDLDGAIELARQAGDPASMIAVEVYEDAKAGKVALADVRDEVLMRQAEEGLL